MDAFESLVGFEPVDVQTCRPRLRATILGGGSANYFDGTNSHVLDAGQTIQPLIHTTPMSGLLGLVQPLLRIVAPKYIQLEIYAGEKYKLGQDKPIWERLYKMSEVATAIEQFLEGASPTTQVIIWRF